MTACTTDISTPAGAPVLTAVTPDFPEMEVLGDGPQQPAAPAAADRYHYYSSVDELAMDMADSQLEPAVVAPVEVSCLSGHVSICLSAGIMSVLNNGRSTSLAASLT